MLTKVTDQLLPSTVSVPQPPLTACLPSTMTGDSYNCFDPPCFRRTAIVRRGTYAGVSSLHRLASLLLPSSVLSTDAAALNPIILHGVSGKPLDGNPTTKPHNSSFSSPPGGSVARDAKAKSQLVHHLTLGQGARTATGSVLSGAWWHPYCRQLSLGTRSNFPAPHKTQAPDWCACTDTSRLP